MQAKQKVLELPEEKSIIRGVRQRLRGINLIKKPLFLKDFYCSYVAKEDSFYTAGYFNSYIEEVVKGLIKTHEFALVDDKSLQEIGSRIHQEKNIIYFNMNDLRAFFIYPDFSLSRWTKAGAELLGSTLKALPKLQYLELIFKNKTFQSEIILGFLDALTGTAPITDLNLRIPSCDDGFIAEFGLVLFRNKTLKNIVFKVKNINPPFLESTVSLFFSRLCWNKSLEQLHLSLPGGIVSASGATLQENLGLYFLTAQLIGMPSLRQLSLKGGISLYFQPKELQTITCHNSQLSYLDFGFQDPYMRQRKEAQAFFAHLLSLQCLSLRLTDVNTCINVLSQLEHLRLAISELHVTVLVKQIKTHLLSFIKANRHLKVLQLENLDEFDSIHDFAFLLSDFRATGIEHFSFRLRPQDAFYAKKVASICQIMEKNPFIVISPSPCLNIATREAKNKKNIKVFYQQLCINRLMEWAHLFTALALKIPGLSIDLLLKTLLMFYDEDIHDVNVALCAQLLLKNFAKRQDIIKQQNPKYDSHTPNISLWWAQSIHTQGGGLVPVFTQNAYATLFKKKEKADLEERKIEPRISKGDCQLM